VTVRSLLLCAAVLGVISFVPPESERFAAQVWKIDPSGNEAPCGEDFARLHVPDREAVTPLAALHDLAYAAAAAGPEGCAWLLAAVVLLAFVRGLWSRGWLGALRRATLAVALGGPACLGLLYASCFLDGRVIRLGTGAVGQVPASLHVHTDRSTGLLTPEDVVTWHAIRGFRVLCVTDGDTIRGAEEAKAFAERDLPPLVPPLLVIVGEECHGRPHVALVNVAREYDLHVPVGETIDRIREVAAAVHADGGALFVAHPWSNMPREIALGQVLKEVDGLEIVNGVIHGGQERVRAVREAEKALLGVVDFKYGPHVNTMTLLREEDARTPAGVAKAIRNRETSVLYAVPGGALTAEEWEAGRVGLRRAIRGLRTLYEATRARRAAWFAAGLLMLGLWWLGTREHPTRAPRITLPQARVLFAVCVALELCIVGASSWDARRAIGSIPIVALLAAAAVVAAPLLVACHTLARAHRAP
jgi:hypothetical protein